MSVTFDSIMVEDLESEIISFLSHDDLTSFEQTSHKAKKFVSGIITEQWKEFPVFSPENNKSRPYIHDWIDIHGRPRDILDIIKLSVFLTRICLRESGAIPSHLFSSVGPELYDKMPKSIIDGATRIINKQTKQTKKDQYTTFARNCYGPDKVALIRKTWRENKIRYVGT